MRNIFCNSISERICDNDDIKDAGNGDDDDDDDEENEDDGPTY